MRRVVPWPFLTLENDRLILGIAGCRVPVPEEWSEDVRDLFGRMLDKDPGRRIEMAALRVGRWCFSPCRGEGRITVARLCANLLWQEHPWVTFGGTKALPSTEEVSTRGLVCDRMGGADSVGR